MSYDQAALQRWAPEPAKAADSGAPRSAFQRDRARVLHSAALRRLAGKTQVVGVGEDDFPRTRLTHSLECAQIGREIGQALGADADLVDAACLAHDLGHPPFGHNGEAALHAVAAACGGFEGNAQSLRLLTRLEVKVPGAGLNLTRASLDASCKYPWTRGEGATKFGAYDDDRAVFDWLRDGAPGRRRPIETQIMDWADDVAYSVHDFEDGVHAGQIDPTRLDADEVVALTRETYLPTAPTDWLYEVFSGLRAQPWWPGPYDGGPASTAALKALTSELIGRFSGAAVAATQAATEGAPLRRYAADLVVPDRARAESALLKSVAVAQVMRRPDRMLEQERERTLITELVEALCASAPASLDPLLRPAWDAAPDDAARLRVICDQVAGLTDASAVAWHARLP